MHDGPKTLGDRSARCDRLAALGQQHVAPLAAFVNRLRAAKGDDFYIPHFDPFDGGVEAECLFLLEAPGARAVESGFISRNNPDETARNFFELNAAAGIDRRRTATWNAVPWYIGTGAKIRPATAADVSSARDAMAELLELLTHLKVIVFLGAKAGLVGPDVAAMRPNIRAFRCPHPSPLFINRSPGNRHLILTQLQAVALALA